MLPPRLRSRVGACAAALIFTGFVAYYGLCCFRYPWGEDAHQYVAGVTALLADFGRPRHESLPVDGQYTIIYSPYLVAVAGLARLFGCSAYRALQAAGVVNLVGFVVAVLFFFRTFSCSRSPVVAAAAFLPVTLLLRAQQLWWSSETSAGTLVATQAYPSIMAWSLALALFGVVNRFLRCGRRAYLAFILLAQASLLLVHPLSGSWSFGIVGLQSLWHLQSARRGGSQSGERPAAILVALACAVVACLLWPWSPSHRLFSFLGQPEDFSGRLTATFWPLWLAALPGAGVLAWQGFHRFFLVALSATCLVYVGASLAGADYLSRYVFYAAFFGQFYTAECFGLAFDAWAGRGGPDASAHGAGGWEHRGAAAAAVVATGLMVWPGWRTAAAGLSSPIRLLKAPSSHDAYYRRLRPLQNHLRPEDVVLMPVHRENYLVSALTSARLVASPYIHLVPDHRQRTADVERFFAPLAHLDERRAILRRYGVTRVIVGKPEWRRLMRSQRARSALRTLLGTELAEDHHWLLFAVSRDPAGGSASPAPSGGQGTSH